MFLKLKAKIFRYLLCNINDKVSRYISIDPHCTSYCPFIKEGYDYHKCLLFNQNIDRSVTMQCLSVFPFSVKDI